jgi:hypothetical protein
MTALTDTNGTAQEDNPDQKETGDLFGPQSPGDKRYPACTDLVHNQAQQKAQHDGLKYGNGLVKYTDGFPEEFHALSFPCSIENGRIALFARSG